MPDRRIPRLYVDRDLGRDRAQLTERETRYLGNVLRLRRGDSVLAFNGRGQERFASISSLSRAHGELTLLDPIDPLPESTLPLTLVQALPKTEAMDLIVQKATELGLKSLWPVNTDFSVVKLDAERAARRAEHWRRIAQSACEQSGRHSPPQIEPVRPLAEALDAMANDSIRLVLDPRAGSTFADTPPPHDDVFLIIGPEGGFSESDMQRLDERGCQRLRLGPRTLRVETAAIVAVGLLQVQWGDLR
jgi:16S rRNA (uracil1498-N3)-methyltransferase